MRVVAVWRMAQKFDQIATKIGERQKKILKV